MNFYSRALKNTFFYGILSSSFLIQSMEQSIAAPDRYKEQTTATNPDKASTLKDLCAKQLASGTTELVTAEHLLCPELKESLKDTLIREHLFFFIDLFKESSYKNINGIPAQFDAIAFSPDNQFILTALHNGSVLLWDLQQHPLTPTIFGKYDSAISCIAFSPDSRYILMGHINGMVQLCDLTQKTLPPVQLTQHTDPQGGPTMVQAVAFSADGKYAFSAGIVNAYCWNITTTPPVREKEVDIMGRTAFTADGRFIVSGLGDTLTVQDLNHPINKLIAPSVHAETFSSGWPNMLISRMALNNCNQLLLADTSQIGAKPQLIYLNKRPLTVALILETPNHVRVRDVALDPQSRYAFVCLDSSTVALYDIQKKSISEKPALIFSCSASRHAPVAISPNGRFVAVAGFNELHFWDLYGTANSLTLPMLQILVSLKNKPELIQNAQVQQALMRFPENVIKPIFAYFKQAMPTIEAKK